MGVIDIIARRSLENGDQQYEVCIGRPVVDEATGDYSCTWWLIDAEGREVTSTTMVGVDAAQALIFAIMIIGDRLAGEGFTWYGLAGTGFPRHLDPRGKPGVISIFADAPEDLFDSPAPRR